MKNQKFFAPTTLLIALIFSLFMAGCTREVISPADLEAEIPSIDFRYDMPEAEYLVAMEQLANPGPAPKNYGPNVQSAMVEKIFALDYANHALITIGGVGYDRPNDQWLSGASAGSVAIPPSLFAELSAASSRLIKVRISNNPFPWFPGFDFRNIRITMLDKGNRVIDGLYQVSSRQYLFLGAGNAVGGQLGNTACGAVTLGRLYGGFNPSFSSINGTLDNGFIVGCSPVVISAAISFFYTGVAVQ